MQVETLERGLEYQFWAEVKAILLSLAGDARKALETCEPTNTAKIVEHQVAIKIFTGLEDQIKGAIRQYKTNNRITEE